MKELETILTARAPGNAYSSDGRFSATLATLPAGLRAMAATHCLNISLIPDSLTWHFGNFGQPGLVEQTEAGLHELGLHELAACFREAKNLMLPLLANRREKAGDPYEIPAWNGLRDVGDKIDNTASTLGVTRQGRKRHSVIYEAWLRYTRGNPHCVFSG